MFEMASDHGPGHAAQGRGEAARPRSVTGDAVNGRGLMIVDALSLEWGACPVPGGGKITWATIAEGGI